MKQLSSEIIKQISDNTGFICITGGGGKTSLMQLLALEYKKTGKTVLMTTTTKIQSPACFKWNCDRIITSKDEINSFKPQKPCSVLYAEPFEIKEKLKAPDIDLLKKIKSNYDVVICEADGSRQNPIKWHTEKDPVIPEFCTYTIAVTGAWGRVESLQDYVDNPEGLLKGSIVNKRIILINGCENLNNNQTIIFSNIQWPCDCVIIQGSVKNNEII